MPVFPVVLENSLLNKKFVGAELKSTGQKGVTFSGNRPKCQLKQTPMDLGTAAKISDFHHYSNVSKCLCQIPGKLDC